MYNLFLLLSTLSPNFVQLQQKSNLFFILPFVYLIIQLLLFLSFTSNVIYHFFSSVSLDICFFCYLFLLSSKLSSNFLQLKKKKNLFFLPPSASISVQLLPLPPFTQTTIHPFFSPLYLLISASCIISLSLLLLNTLLSSFNLKKKKTTIHSFSSLLFLSLSVSF